MNLNNYSCSGQMDMFGYMESLHENKEIPVPEYKVGDVLGRLILGEVEKGTIYKVEGNERYRFYRTDVGCFGRTEGSTDLEALEREAEKIRKNYKTIIPYPLEKRITIKYPPRECDGEILTAQIGTYQGMLYWKEAYTYEFLEPYDTEKELMKAYKKRLQKMTDKNTNQNEWEEVDELTTIHRLYWSKHGIYASPRYVEHEG